MIMTHVIIYTLSSIGVLATAIIGPAMGEIALYFNDVDPTLVKLIMTISSLFVIPSTYLSIIMYKKFGKKKTLLVALAIYAIAGSASGLFSNIYAVLFCRALLGIGLGMLIPVGNSLPLDYFRGAELAKVTARQSASISLGNFCFVLFSGWLALLSWRYTFLIYAVAIPIMICIFFFFPEEIYKDEVKQDDKITKSNNVKLPPIIYFQACVMFLFMIVIYSYHTGVAILLQERGIGTAASAAYVLSTNSLASFCAALIIRRLHALIDKYIFALICLSVALGFYCLYAADGLPLAFMAAIFIAFSMGSIMSTNGILINKQAERHNLSKALTLKGLSIVNITIFLGQFAAPIVFDSLPNFSDNPDIGGSYLTFSMIFFILAPLVALFCFTKIKVKVFR